MRRALVRGLLTIAALVVVVPAGLAQAREPMTDPLNSGSPNGPIDLGLSNCKTFTVHVAVVTNNESQQVTKQSDGTTIRDIAGNLVLRFTNNSTGKNIVRNVGGPRTATDHPDGTETFVGRGLDWAGFGPRGQANTREPGLVFTSGLVTVKIANGVAQKFSLSGTQENGCALLSS